MIELSTRWDRDLQLIRWVARASEDGTIVYGHDVLTAATRLARALEIKVLALRRNMRRVEADRIAQQEDAHGAHDA